MELYTLDDNFLKQGVPIDSFTSVIWTERYNQYGEITLVWDQGGPLDDIIFEDTFVHLPESPDVMLIDTLSTDKGVTTATGQSLTGFLANRMFRNTWSTASDSWSLNGVPGTIAGYVVEQMCMAGGIMAGSAVIPGGGAAEVIEKLTIGPTAAGVSIVMAIPYGNVYDAVKAICDLDNLGFRLYPPSTLDGTGNLIFTTYRGLDRTTSQNVNEFAVLEPAADNFTDVTELRSKSGYKNVAYAWANSMTSQSTIGMAVAPGDTSTTKFKRRTLMVAASDVNAGDYTAANLEAVLNQKAADALANNNYVRMTDGTIVPQDNFVYGVNYSLGDVIELRGNSSVAQKARVIEYIRSQDSNGETAYPTLSVIT